MNRSNTRDSVATTDQESSFDIARAQFDRVADRLNLDATRRAAHGDGCHESLQILG